MEYPRFPDWLVYGVVAGAIVAGAVSRRERADAPAAPPPPPGAESVPLGPDSPFDPVSVVRTPKSRAAVRGTAFSVSEKGVWLTAAINVERCPRPALRVAEGRAVRARRLAFDDANVAILTTPGGPPGMPLESATETRPGLRGYLPGFASTGPGEYAAMLVTWREPHAERRHMQRTSLVWAQNGHTIGLDHGAARLVGGPLISAESRVVGVVTGFEPRRGRILSTNPQTLQAALKAAGVMPSLNAAPEQITGENYGRIADDLRRGRQVAQVLCLRR